MTVGSWQPEPAAAALTPEIVDRLHAAAQLAGRDEPAFDAETMTQLAAYARDGGPGSTIDWAGAAESLDSDRIVTLIRFFTQAEMMFPGWKSGDRSPVIALAAVLKRRGEFPAGLTAWIRANSDNRFLPYGSLLRRL